MTLVHHPRKTARCRVFSLWTCGLLGILGVLLSPRPHLAALVTDRTPDSRRGAVVGTFSAVMLVGQSAGAFAFGYISQAVGYADPYHFSRAFRRVHGVSPRGYREGAHA